MYNFGVNLGIAFQLQDDLLDAFGDPKTFGKKVGGDIVENKKTILYHLTRAHATAKDLTDFEQLMSSTSQDEDQKIKDVKAIYESTHARRRTTEQVMTDTKNALDALNAFCAQSRRIAFTNSNVDPQLKCRPCPPTSSVSPTIHGVVAVHRCGTLSSSSPSSIPTAVSCSHATPLPPSRRALTSGCSMMPRGRQHALGKLLVIQL